MEKEIKKPSEIADTMKWFMFGGIIQPVKENENGMKHHLEFVSWADENQFIIKNHKGEEFRVTITEENS